MVEVNPKLTTARLKKGARTTSEGKGIAPLPGIKTDANCSLELIPRIPNLHFTAQSTAIPKAMGKIVCLLNESARLWGI